MDCTCAALGGTKLGGLGRCLQATPLRIPRPGKGKLRRDRPPQPQRGGPRERAGAWGRQEAGKKVCWLVKDAGGLNNFLTVTHDTCREFQHVVA